MIKTLITIGLVAAVLLPCPSAVAAQADHPVPEFVTAIDGFSKIESEQGLTTIGEKLAFRAKQQPILLISSIIFLLAILHTFFAIPISKLAHKIQHAHDERYRKLNPDANDSTNATHTVSFRATILHFLGEVEAIFGIWVIILITAIATMHGMDDVRDYFANVNFT